MWRFTRSASAPVAPSGPRPSEFPPDSQECYAGTTHAILGFHKHTKPEAIDRCCRRFLRLNVSKFPGNQDERILVVGVHVLKESTAHPMGRLRFTESMAGCSGCWERLTLKN